MCDTMVMAQTVLGPAHGGPLTRYFRCIHLSISIYKSTSCA